MALKQLFVWFSLLSVAYAATISPDNINSTSCDNFTGEGCDHITGEGRPTNPPACEQLCGCDGTLVYDKKSGDCVLNVRFVRKEISYPIAGDDDDDDGMSLEDAIAKMRNDKVDQVFRGIVVSGIFFIVCASICVLSVCIFCCHIRHSDRKLRSEVKTLAKKLKVDINKKSSAPLIRKKQRDQKEESCNVVVADANIMCV